VVSFNGDDSLRKDHPETTAAAPAAVPAIRGSRVRPAHEAQWPWEPRVLVVDDDPVCELAAQRLLKNLGIGADAVAGGADALAVSADWPYVAIFMDCATEAVDRYRTARRIRARDGPEYSPPVIAVTSLARQVCLTSGMDDHIAKPLRLDTLQAACEQLGLVPRPGIPLSPATSRRASGVALLDPPSGQTARGTAELAATFARDALRVLPALWRAANLRDLDALARAASDLAQRAAEAGAARVAALCRELGAAAAGGQVDAAAELEVAVRQALRLTAGTGAHAAEVTR
jgi:two-component system sensor histidine kinase/response regulator